MFSLDQEKKAAEFAREFLSRYNSVGFGTLSKREVDLLMIDLLEQHLPGFSDLPDFDAARRLKSTKRRVRGLRDEVAYRRSQSDAELSAGLREELSRAEIVPANDWQVKVQIEDAVLRNFAEGIIRSDYGLVDTSFNSTILSLTPEKFLFLAFKVLPDDELSELESVLEEISTEQKAAFSSKAKSNFQTFKDAFIQGAGKEAGKLMISGAFAMLSGGATFFLGTEKPAEAVGKSIGQALKAAWKYFTGKDDKNAATET